MLGAQGPDEPFKAEFKAYFECNDAGASEIWRQNGEPVSLAFAVTHQCHGEWMTLGQAILRARSMSVANEMLAQAKKLAVERNTASIVKKTRLLPA